MAVETTELSNLSSTEAASTSSGNIPLDFTTAETNAAAVTLLMIMVLSLVGNFTICYVVFRNRRMWTEMNMFLVNLAIGDIATSLLSMTAPLEATITREWPFGRGPVCQLNAFCNSVLFCNTIFTHTAISIDRFLAVVKPMRKIMTKKKALFGILSVWTVSILISLVPIFGWGYNDYNGSTIQCGFGFPRSRFESFYIIFLAVFAFLLPIIIMSYVYIRIYRVVLHHTRRLSASTFGVYQKGTIQQQQKTVVTFFLALIAFIVCWTPFFVFIAVAVSISSRDEIPHGLGIAAYWFGFLNSAINPYLIGLRSERFHEAFKRVFCWWFSPCTEIFNRQSTQNSTSDKTSDAETKNRSVPQFSTQQNKLDQNGDAVTSFTNGALIKADHTVQEIVTLPQKSHFRHEEENLKRKGRQEKADAVVYQHFIHLVEGKVWNEATV